MKSYMKSLSLAASLSLTFALVGCGETPEDGKTTAPAATAGDSDGKTTAPAVTPDAAAPAAEPAKTETPAAEPAKTETPAAEPAKTETPDAPKADAPKP